jgi:hypothetical protein
VIKHTLSNINITKDSIDKSITAVFHVIFTIPVGKILKIRKTAKLVWNSHSHNHITYIQDMTNNGRAFAATPYGQEMDLFIQKNKWDIVKQYMQTLDLVRF